MSDYIDKLARMGGRLGSQGPWTRFGLGDVKAPTATIVAQRHVCTTLGGVTAAENAEAIVTTHNLWDEVLAVARAADDWYGVLDEHQDEDGSCFECESEWPCIPGQLAQALRDLRAKAEAL